VATQFVNALKDLIDLATVVSFIIAPFAGFLNYSVVTSKDVGELFQPPKWLKGLAISGMIFLGVFTLIYLYFIS